MRDVRERTAVDEGQIVLERLNDVGFDGVFQQGCHCAIGFQITCAHRFAPSVQADHDLAESRLEVGDRGGKAENRHDLGCHGDVKTALTWVAVGGAAQPDDDLAQRTVVHVHHALPGDATRVDVQGVAVLDVVVDHCGEQVVGCADGVEVTGEVQIDVFHRNNLGITAAGRATLDAEAGSKRGLPQTDDGALAQPIQRIAKPNGGGGLAFTGRRRADGCHQDELAIGAVLQALDVVQRQLGLEVAVGFKVFSGNAVLALRKVDNWPLVRGLRDFYVGHQGELNTGRAHTSAGHTTPI